MKKLNITCLNKTCGFVVEAWISFRLLLVLSSFLLCAFWRSLTFTGGYKCFSLDEHTNGLKDVYALLRHILIYNVNHWEILLLFNLGSRSLWIVQMHLELMQELRLVQTWDQLLAKRYRNILDFVCWLSSFGGIILRYGNIWLLFILCY